MPSLGPNAYPYPVETRALIIYRVERQSNRRRGSACALAHYYTMAQRSAPRSYAAPPTTTEQRLSHLEMLSNEKTSSNRRRRRLLQSKSMPGFAPVHFVDRVRSNALSNRLRHESSCDDYAAVKLSIEETQILCAEHESRVQALRSEIETQVRSAREAVQAREVAESEMKAMMATMVLQRKRLQLLKERELEAQRRLVVYDRLSPIFNKLQSKFRFQNAEEVIERIETLELAETRHCTSQNRLEDRVKKLEKNLVDQKRLREAERQSNQTERLRLTSAHEKRVAALQEQLEGSQRESAFDADFKKKYLKLNNVLWGLWNTVQTIPGQSPANDEELPAFDENEQIVAAIDAILARNVASRAGERLRQLTILANRFWRRYWPDDMALKFQPTQAFERLGTLVDDRSAKLKEVSEALRLEKEERKRLKIQLRRALRDKSIAETEMKRWQRAAGGRQASTR